jgi:hypothetical protein
VAEPLRAPIFAGDPRGADLQTQLHDLTLALEDWRRTREYSQTTEERLAHITVQCARMVEAWQQMDRRTGDALGPQESRGDWGSVESRLQQETGERIRTLERTIEHEWEALRENNDEPTRQLREKAATVPQPSASAAPGTDLTLRGLANVEARLAALEQDLQSRMADMSRDLQAVIAELRHARPQASQSAASAFPLESVMRIHEELRTPVGPTPPMADALNPAATRALPERAESATELTARVDSLEKAVSNVAAPQTDGSWRPLYSAIAVAAALVGMVVFGLWMQRRVDSRLNEAAARVSAAERDRDLATAATRQEAARTRDEAARQVAEARQSAAQAQIVGNVLAAPDRLRYWLTAVDPATRAYAQVLFSRSRGIVFSASRLPSAGDGKAYQLWLLTSRGPVSAGVISPDAAGRVTLAADVPASLQGRLIGAVVTREPAAGATQPSEDKALIKVE